MTPRRWWALATIPVLIVAIVVTQLLVATGSAATPALRGFTSCDELHDFFVERSLERASSDRDYIFAEEEEAAEEEATEETVVAEAEAADVDAISAPASGGGPVEDRGETSETGTNVQERGVDEPDIIKTDGAYIYVLQPQSLLVTRIVEGGPVVEVGRITFNRTSHRQELLIGVGKAVVVRQLEDGARALPLGLDDAARPQLTPQVVRPQLEVLEIGLDQPAAPRWLRSLDLDGRFVSARLVGGNVHLVMRQEAYLPWASRWDFRRSSDWEQYNEALAEQSKLGQWYPLFGVQDHISHTFDQGYAVDCTQTYAPEDGGANLSFMLSFDLERGIDEWGSVAVMSNDPTVYASTNSLYLAGPSDSWRDSVIHRFDISDPLSPSYFGSGTVRGQLLSQWALSEHDGYLRVATTIRDRWPRVSNVFVLESVVDEASPTGGALEQVGLVSGLGVNEDIFAVRFMGDVGYVVTFRQIDPLYVLDLSDPTNPQAVGELKIPGFSRYLHPLGEGLLFAIGRDADPRTGRELGLQASLFDVSDPANPTQIAVLPLGDDARSPVEFDHRAFRYQDGVAWIPVGPDAWHLRERHDGAFLGVRVSAEGLNHESSLRVQGEARRALPVGAQIHLLSREEIRTYSLEDYSDQGRLRFADEWDTSWVPVRPE